MNYTSLIAAKGVTGSIANWVGYNRLDLPAVLDEAQSLIYEVLRVREMRTAFNFAVTPGQSSFALPFRFLDPFGKIYDSTNGCTYDHVIESSILQKRSYDPSLSGTFGTDPFATTSASAVITATKTAHNLTQDSSITIPNAPALNGLSMSGTFNVSSVPTANTFTFSVADVQAADGTTANATGTGGGAGVTYTANQLVSGFPTCWSIWAERLHFDTAFDVAAACKLLYYRRPELLSATNLTNFLTDRHPKLVRVATTAAAAEFMKDDNEYQKGLAALNNLISTIAEKDDLQYRGASFGTDTP